MHLFGLEKEPLRNQDIMATKDGFFEMAKTVAVKLNEECLSCAGDEQTQKRLFAAYKQACLNYEPTEIIYKGKSMQRKKILEFMHELLDAEWRSAK